MKGQPIYINGELGGSDVELLLYGGRRWLLLHSSPEIMDNLNDLTKLDMIDLIGRAEYISETTDESDSSPVGLQWFEWMQVSG